MKMDKIKKFRKQIDLNRFVSFLILTLATWVELALSSQPSASSLQGPGLCAAPDSSLARL